MLSADEYYVLKSFLDAQYSIDSGNPIIRKMLDYRFIEYCEELRPPYTPLQYWITSKSGIAAMLEFEKSVQDSRNVVTEKKKNYIFQIALVFLGGAITLVVEHAPAIWDFLSSLFQ